MIQSHQPHDSAVQIVYMQSLFDGMQTKLIRGPDNLATLHATARHPGRGVTVADFRLVAVVEP